MFWAYGSFVAGRTLTLVATAILAHLLTPREFGLVALALVFMLLLETLSDLGVSQALVIVEKEHEEEQADTVFVWSALFGVVLSAVTAGASPLVAAFFDEPALKTILPALGCRFLLRSLAATHYALAQKRLDFRSRTAAELADTTVRGLTAITLAIAGVGVWSLVIGYLAGTVGLVVVLWAMVPWRPTLRPQTAHLRRLLGFGGTLTGVDILAAVQSNIDYILIGRVLGATDLGLYTLGFRVPELLILNASVVAGRVLFPAFAAVDRERLGRAFLLSLRYTLMLALPVAAALTVLAEPVVLTLFGSQWERSVPAMQLLTLYAFAVTVGIPAGTAYKAIGRAGVLLALGIPRTILLVGAVAIFVNEGIVAVAACMAGVTLLFAAIGLALAMRLLAVGPRSVWSAAWPLVVASAAMAAVMLPLDRAIEPHWLTLVSAGLLGGAVYVALLWALARDALEHLRDTAFPDRARRDDVTLAREADATDALA
jgi:PST family polysaccharide transporter